MSKREREPLPTVGRVPKRPRKTYACKWPGCDKYFVAPSQVKYHTDAVHKKIRHDCPKENCKKSFSNRCALLGHIRKHEGKTFDCHIEGCDKSYTSMAGLHQHLKKKHEYPLKCKEEDCDRHFYCPEKLKKHYEDHIGVYKCYFDGCEKEYRDRTTLSIHEATHKGPYKCDMCGKKYTLPGTLAKHKKRHTEKPKTCPWEGCKWTYYEKAKFTYHYRTHTKDFPYKCDTCDAKFPRNDQLTRHKTIHAKEKAFKCPQCDQSFRRKDGLDSHMKIHAVVWFPCPDCDKRFRSLSSLEAHKFKHTGYPCQICGKRIGTAADLRLHMLIHSGSKPHRCPDCDRRFRNVKSLKVHQLRHSGVKNFECSKCPRKFYTKDELKAHFHTHSLTMNFQCDLCDEKFQTPRGLADHKKIHTNIRYECSECGRKFYRKSDRNKHERQHRIRDSWKFECGFVEGGLHPSTGDNGFKCQVRCKTKAKLEYHIQASHTVEGLQKKYKSEEKLAQFFKGNKIPYLRDWENRVNTKTCIKDPGQVSARPDFFLPTYTADLQAVVLVGNDEFAHRMTKCDFRRTNELVSSIRTSKRYEGAKVLYIRFNPHFYYVGKDMYDMSLLDGHRKLLRILNGIKKDDLRDGLNLIYVNYDQNGEDDIEEFWQLLEIFEGDEGKTLRECVIGVY